MEKFIDFINKGYTNSERGKSFRESVDMIKETDKQAKEMDFDPCTPEYRVREIEWYTVPLQRRLTNYDLLEGKLREEINQLIERNSVLEKLEFNPLKENSVVKKEIEETNLLKHEVEKLKEEVGVYKKLENEYVKKDPYRELKWKEVSKTIGENTDLKCEKEKCWEEIEKLNKDHNEALRHWEHEKKKYKINEEHQLELLAHYSNNKPKETEDSEKEKALMYIENEKLKTQILVLKKGDKETELTYLRRIVENFSRCIEK